MGISGWPSLGAVATPDTVAEAVGRPRASPAAYWAFRRGIGRSCGARESVGQVGLKIYDRTSFAVTDDGLTRDARRRAETTVWVRIQIGHPSPRGGAFTPLAGARPCFTATETHVTATDKDDVVERLLLEVKETERLSDAILERRRTLYQLTVAHPGKVIEYFGSQPVPTDPIERRLRDTLLKIAANSVLESLKGEP